MCIIPQELNYGRISILKLLYHGKKKSFLELLKNV